MERWVGSNAIVTGASSGIGAAIAEKFVRAGINVVGLARRMHLLEQLSEEVRDETAKFYPIQCDISEEENLLKVFIWVEENLGGVSIMVNNAGILLPTKIIDGDYNMWKKTVDTNFLALSIATRESIKSMKKHGIDGQIIHINSVAGHFVPNIGEPCLNVYSPTKHAITAATETLRRELNYYKSKIKVTSISPGFVKTDIILDGSVEGMDDTVVAAPLLNTEDIADACLYVLSTPPHCQIHEIMIRPVGEEI